MVGVIPLHAMNTYGVKPESFKTFQKRLLLVYSLSIASSVMGAVFIFPFRDRNGILAIITAVVLVLIIASIAINRTIKRMREVWSTYTLTAGDDFILKTQSHHSDIKIYSDEIKMIRKSFAGDVAVKTRDWKKFIIIPRSLDRIDEVEQLLAQWKPIKTTSAKTLFLFLSLAITAFLGFLFSIRYYLSQYFFSDRQPSLTTIKVALFILVSISIIGLWVLRSLPQIDERAKPKRWVFIILIAYLILMAISIAISIFIKSS